MVKHDTYSLLSINCERDFLLLMEINKNSFYVRVTSCPPDLYYDFLTIPTKFLAVSFGEVPKIFFVYNLTDKLTNKGIAPTIKAPAKINSHVGTVVTHSLAIIINGDVRGNSEPSIIQVLSIFKLSVPIAPKKPTNIKTSGIEKTVVQSWSLAVI